MDAATAMFPLGSVLFPYMPLPLRIFEERYRIMLGTVLDDAEPAFGVVLIERGFEAGGGDHRFGIGTLARLTHVAAGATDVHVVARGAERFEVEEWLPDDPYPRAKVRPVPDLTWNEALTPLRAEAERTVRRVLARAAEYSETSWPADVELSEDPVESSWQLAAIAPLGDLDQLRLLRSPTMGGLLAGLIDLTLAAEPVLTAGSADRSFEEELDALSRAVAAETRAEPADADEEQGDAVRDDETGDEPGDDTTPPRP